MLVDVGKHLESVVLASVVHKHQFIVLADSVHHFGQLHVQGRDVFLFVKERNDNRELDGRIASHSDLLLPAASLLGLGDVAIVYQANPLGSDKIPNPRVSKYL